MKNTIKTKLSESGILSSYENYWSICGTEKAIVYDIVQQLIRLCNDNGDTVLIKQYEAALNCLHRLLVSEDTVRGMCCKNKFCFVCNRKLQNEKIEEWFDEISSWPDACFLTLTIEGIYKADLKRTIQEMIKTFSSILEKFAKRDRRRSNVSADNNIDLNSITLCGFRFLECTFCKKTDLYKPHFHLLVPSKEIAEILIKEWKERNNAKVSLDAQKIKPVLKNEKSIKQIIKYCIKALPIESYRKGSKSVVHLNAINHILKCFKGQRRISKFGIKLSKKIKNNRLIMIIR